MMRNVTENEFWTSKMTILKNNESMKLNKLILDIQNGHRRTFCKKATVLFGSEMARNVTNSEFRTSQMAAIGHFGKKIENCVLI